MEQKKQPQDWKSFFSAVPMLTTLVALGLVFLIGMSIFAFARRKPAAQPAPPAQQTEQVEAETGTSDPAGKTDNPGGETTPPADSEPEAPAPSESETEVLPAI